MRITAQPPQPKGFLGRGVLKTLQDQAFLGFPRRRIADAPQKCCLFDAMVRFLPDRQIPQDCNRPASMVKRLHEVQSWVPQPAHCALKGRILEDIMKKLALAAALSVVATGAFAGGYVEPAVIEPVVIVEDTGSSAGGILVPAIAVLILILALHHS